LPIPKPPSVRFWLPPKAIGASEDEEDEEDEEEEEGAAVAAAVGSVLLAVLLAAAVGAAAVAAAAAGGDIAFGPVLDIDVGGIDWLGSDAVAAVAAATPSCCV